MIQNPLQFMDSMIRTFKFIWPSCWTLMLWNFCCFLLVGYFYHLKILNIFSSSPTLPRQSLQNLFSILFWPRPLGLHLGVVVLLVFFSFVPDLKKEKDRTLNMMFYFTFFLNRYSLLSKITCKLNRDS